jgi:hypothetical protein
MRKMRNSYTVRFEDLTAMVIKSTIFWDITPCSLFKVNRRFGGTYRLNLQGRRNKFSKKTSSKQVANDFFDLEDGGDMFLRNIG